MKTKAFFIYRINTVQMVCSGEIKYYLMQTRPNENEPRKYRFSAESTNSLYQLGLSTFHSFKKDKNFFPDVQFNVSMQVSIRTELLIYFFVLLYPKDV